MKIPIDVISTEYESNRGDHLFWQIYNDSSMQRNVSVICPHCNQLVAAIQHIDITHGSFHSMESLYYVLECPACMKPIILDCINEISFPEILPFDNVKSLPGEYFYNIYRMP